MSLVLFLGIQYLNFQILVRESHWWQKSSLKILIGDALLYTVLSNETEKCYLREDMKKIL